MYTEPVNQSLGPGFVWRLFRVICIGHSFLARQSLPRNGIPADAHTTHVSGFLGDVSGNSHGEDQPDGD
jgi:hypothetical protein